jgi:SAM-dependent methyltransferase
LEQIPSSCTSVIEIGCGTGRLVRAVAGRAEVVVGIDVSPEMIRLARERARDDPRICFVCADFLTYPMSESRFDCVISVATLHHFPPAMALARMKALLRPGGVLVLHDVRSPSGPIDWLQSALGAIVNGDAWWWLRARLRDSGALRSAWHDHGAGERYLTMRGARDLCEIHLPGARIHRHPLWRYTAIWTRTETG